MENKQTPEYKKLLVKLEAYGEANDLLKQEAASLQSEIDRLNQENEELKENYEGMTSHCKYLTEINVFNMAFDKADSNWRKSHKVEEGENFIDWYMRHHAAEREADRKQIDSLKKEISNHQIVNSLAAGDETEVNLANKVFSLQSEIDRLKEERAELIKALQSINDLVQFQSSGYARSVSVLAENILTRIK